MVMRKMDDPLSRGIALSVFNEKYGFSIDFLRSKDSLLTIVSFIIIVSEFLHLFKDHLSHVKMIIINFSNGKRNS